MRDFQGKVALVTGGAGAIGGAIAKACVAAGMRVAIADVDEQQMQERVVDLGSQFCRAYKLDVRDQDQWANVADAIEQDLGPVRLLFNNAGVSSTRAVSLGGGIENLTLEEWRWTIAVNLDGVFLGLKTFIPRFKQTSERTHIVNTSSKVALAALRADGGAPLSYSASKAGIAHMTAQLRTDLDEQGITSIGLSVLYPGLTKSNIFEVSYRLSPGADLDAFNKEEGRRTFHQQGADPDAVGRYILEAIQRGDFHILTHGEWRDNILAYGEELRHSFVASADAAYVDPTAQLVDLTWAKKWPDRT